MIDFNCPKCGELLSVPDSLTGQAETCPTCGNVCVVAQPAAVPDPPPRWPPLKLWLQVLIPFGAAAVLGLILYKGMAGDKTRRTQAAATGTNIVNGKYSLGTCGDFKPLLDDFGAQLTDEGTDVRGQRFRSYMAGRKQFSWVISLTLAGDNHVTEIETIWAGHTETTPVGTLRMLEGLSTLPTRCKGWDHAGEPGRIMRPLLDLIEQAKQNPDEQATASFIEDGIECSLSLMASSGLGTLSLKRIAPAKSNVPSLPYKPIFPQVMVSNIRWKFAPQPYAPEFGTLSWQYQLKNSTWKAWDLTTQISFRDSEGFEVSAERSGPLNLEGRGYRDISESTLMAATKAARIVDAVVKVEGY